MSYRIPFNKPFMVGPELYYVAQTVLSGNTGGNGAFAARSEELLERQTGAARVFMTHSCTAALELAAMLCDVGEGDEVILPSYTFVSTANAFVLRGAKLRFVDVRRDTLNMDESLLEAAISERTKVIAPVHYAGVGCEMDEILAVADRHGVRVVEDAAQGVDATYRGKYLGSFGDFGCFSFHETKNFICGEGGAILIRDPELANRVDVLRNKGTDRGAFLRGEADHYAWQAVGSSYVPSDILSAFLYAQLEAMGVITARRRAIHQRYNESLRPLAERGLLVLPTIPEHCSSNFHMFYVLLDSLETRTSLISHLKSKGILAVFHYVPLHTSPMGRQMGYSEGMLPVTEDLSDRLLRLPFYYDLTDGDVDSVVDEIFAFFRVARPARPGGGGGDG